MSSDATRDPHRFGRLVGAVVAALLVLVVALGAANAFRGPRVLDAVADVSDATRLAGATVEFRLNQPVGDTGALRVEPEAEASVAVDDRTVRVAFDAPLSPSQEYVIELDGVTAPGGGPATTLRYAFSTEAETLHVLQRRNVDGEDDRILRASTGGGEPEVVLTAPRIRSFAHAGDVVAAVELLPDDATQLRFATAGQAGAAAPLALPEPGTVTSIAGSTTHPWIGFVVAGSGDAATSTLYLVDVSGAPGGTPQPVLGLDGQPLLVADWMFVPGSPSVVVHDRDGAMFLVDPLGTAPPAPLGSHAELRGVLPGTTTLVIADPDRGATLDLATGETTTLELPPADLPEGAYPGRVTSLDAAGAHLVDVLLVDGEGGFASLLARADAAGTSIAYAPPAGSRMLEYCLAPGGRLVAVETAGPDSVEDGYPGEPWTTGTLTTLVDLADGRVLLSLPGGLTDWCR